MLISTSKFGSVEIDDAKIIVFKKGLLGFEDYKEYAIINTQNSNPFYWLQSIHNKEIAFPCINPYVVFPSYSPKVSEAILEEMNIDSDEHIIILTTVTVPNNPHFATTNLAAPIIINTKNNSGIQYVLQSDEYSVRHFLFQPDKEAQNADTIAKAK
jgi:flagellar assembly factor FliW